MIHIKAYRITNPNFLQIAEGDSINNWGELVIPMV